MRVLARWWIVVAALLSSSVAPAQRAPDSLRIIFFDVGQGDAALITTPDSKNILIDAGPSGALIVAKLDSLGVKKLDLVVASHNHADHIGGMADVLAATEVKEYVDNGVPALTKTYRRTVDAINAEKGMRLRSPQAREFRAGKVSVRILAPPFDDLSQNDNTVGVWVQYGSFSAVFTGDAERAELMQWLTGYGYRVSKVSIVKASHHGSVNGASADWVRATRPKFVAVSVGAGNQYGHPDSGTVARWSAAGARVYRTDQVGTITVMATEHGAFSVKTSGGQPVWVSP